MTDTPKTETIKRSVNGPVNALGLTIDQTYMRFSGCDKYDVEYEEPADRASKTCATCAFFRQRTDMYDPWGEGQGCQIVRQNIQHQGTCGVYINAADAIAAVMMQRAGIQRMAMVAPEAMQKACAEGLAMYQNAPSYISKIVLVRAEQVAQAKPVSLQMIDDMLDIAEKYEAVKDQAPEEGAGKIVWLLNGGDTCMEWCKKMSGESSAEGVETEIEMSIKIVRAEVVNEKQLTYGVVYAPQEVDSHGTWMDAKTIEESAHDFMASVRRMGIQHETLGIDADIVESYIAPVDMEFVDITGAVQKVQRGSWVLVQRVNDAKLWADIKSGKINAYSIGGVGLLVDEDIKNG